MINIQYVLKGKYRDLLGGPMVKELLCNAEDAGLLHAASTELALLK